MLLQNFNYMPDTCFFFILLCSFLYFLTFHSFLSIILKYILSFFFPDQQEHFYTEMPRGWGRLVSSTLLHWCCWVEFPSSLPPSLLGRGVDTSYDRALLPHFCKLSPRLFHPSSLSPLGPIPSPPTSLRKWFSISPRLLGSLHQTSSSLFISLHALA